MPTNATARDRIGTRDYQYSFNWPRVGDAVPVLRVCLKQRRDRSPLMPSVLIIEDDADSRRAMAELFTREDWKVLEAGDGDAGVDLAVRHRPEVILCDLLMPKS